MSGAKSVSGTTIFLHQLRFEWKLFWRNPGSVFFSVAMPLIFLFLLGLVFITGDDRDSTYGLRANEYLVGAIATLGIVGACFNNIAMTLTHQRESGALKRLRGTPLPTAAFVLARCASAVVNAVLIVAVIFLAGWLAFGARFNFEEIVGSLIVTVVGAATFSALGFAITVVIRSLSAATPITNSITLPLYFISGVFGDIENLPKTLADIGQVFPIAHLGACFYETLSPNNSGVLAFSAKDFAILVAWGVAGVAIAAWKFKWEPQGES